MSKKKILIIDDDESILSACEMTLLDAGYDVRTIDGDGAVVKQKARETMPDLIILDMMLSGSDGRIVAKELKSDDKTKTIPILLVSGYPELRSAARETGVDAYLEKPFEVADFMTAVKEYIH